MQNKSSPSLEENSPRNSTSKPLENIERRIAEQALELAKKNFRNLLLNWLTTDPGATPIIQRALRTEFPTLREEFFSKIRYQVIDQQTKFLEMQRQLQAKRQTEWAAESEKLLQIQHQKKMVQLERRRQVSCGFIIFLLITIILVAAAPMMGAEIWSAKEVPRLEAENNNLRHEIRLLRDQPELEQRVLLLPYENEIWAEVSADSQSKEFTLKLSGQPSRNVIMINLRTIN